MRAMRLLVADYERSEPHRDHQERPEVEDRDDLRHHVDSDGLDGREVCERRPQPHEEQSHQADQHAYPGTSRIG